MKYILKVICILSVSVLFCGCEKWMAEHLGREIMSFRNNADYTVSIYSAMITPNRSPIYPDTTLPYSASRIIDIAPRDDKVVYSSPTGGSILEVYESYNTDTISFFVFSTESLSTLGWDSARTSYLILQRYDIGFHDLFLVPQGPTFPPTEEMRNIKMWPPYGTYDANGHRIDTTKSAR